MLKKGTKLYSILKMKCPQCHEGEFFISHPYNLKKAGDLHVNCEDCGLKYSKEPYFYFGAMFVSYALGVALFVSLWVGFNLFIPETAAGIQVLVISALSIVLAPYLYALSKIMWANFFFKYKAKEPTD